MGLSSDRLETDRARWEEVPSASFYNPREVVVVEVPIYSLSTTGVSI